MKKIVATLIGIELGLLLIGVTFLTLIGYLFTGILAHLFGLVLPIEHGVLQSYFGYIISIIIVSTTVFLSLKLSSKFHNYFKWLVIILPIGAGLIYLTAFKPIDKISAVRQELKNHSTEYQIVDSNYTRRTKFLKSKLNDFAETETPTSNLYLGVFSTNQDKVDSIIIDTLFLSPDRQIGLCIFTIRTDEKYSAVSIFFNPKNNQIYSGLKNLSHFGDSRNEALVNLYYELYVERKERRKATYSPEYKKWTENVPTILDSDYWITTLKEDTVDMKEYGEI